jgi:hypothetical protein
VHGNLRKELEKILGTLEQVKTGAMSIDRARSALNEMTIRQNNWKLGAYCASYCTRLTRHHGIEDESIFLHLRSADAGLAPVIDRLEQEHLIIHEVIEGVDRALVDLVRTEDDFTELQDAIDILSDTLLSWRTRNSSSPSRSPVTVSTPARSERALAASWLSPSGRILEATKPTEGPSRRAEADASPEGRR